MGVWFGGVNVFLGGLSDSMTKIIHPVYLLLLVSLLNGCSLTRVSDKTHAREVDNLNIIGMRLDAAVEKVSSQGFECDSGSRTSHVQTENGVLVLKQLECSKTNLELFCPQIRNVVLNADINTNRVVLVGNYITQRACF